MTEPFRINWRRELAQAVAFCAADGAALMLVSGPNDSGVRSFMKVLDSEIQAAVGDSLLLSLHSSMFECQYPEGIADAIIQACGGASPSEYASPLVSIAADNKVGGDFTVENISVELGESQADRARRQREQIAAMRAAVERVASSRHIILTLSDWDKADRMLARWVMDVLWERQLSSVAGSVKCIVAWDSIGSDAFLEQRRAMFSAEIALPERYAGDSVSHAIDDIVSVLRQTEGLEDERTAAAAARVLVTASEMRPIRVINGLAAVLTTSAQYSKGPA